MPNFVLEIVANVGNLLLDFDVAHILRKYDACKHPHHHHHHRHRQHLPAELAAATATAFAIMVTTSTIITHLMATIHTKRTAKWAQATAQNIYYAVANKYEQ